MNHCLFQKHKILLFVLFLSALLLRLEYKAAFFDFTPDNAAQICCAVNLLHGRGISLSFTDPDDLSQDRTIPNFSWPWGYPVCLAGFLFVFRHPLLASYLLDAVAIAIILTSIYGIFRLLAFPFHGMVVLLLMLGVNYCPFMYFTSTCLWSLALYLAACFFSIKLLTQEKAPLTHWLLPGILLFCSCFFRYSYYPMTTAIPAAFLFTGLLQRNPAKIKGGCWILACAATLILGQTLLMKWISGSGVYVSNNTSTGFFPEHLLHLDEFPVKALIQTVTLRQLLGFEHNSPLFSLMLHGCSAVILGYLICKIFRIRLWEKFKTGPVDAQHAFLLIGLFTILINAASLMLLSLRYPPQTNWTAFWTFVQETRYFAPAMIFLMMFMIYFAFGKYADRFGKVAVLAILCVSFLFCAYGLNKRYIMKDPTGLFGERNQERVRIETLLREIEDAGVKRLVYADEDGVLLRYVYLQGKPGQRGVSKTAPLAGRALNASAPTTLIINLQKPEIEQYTGWLAQYQAICLTDSPGHSLFRIDLPSESVVQRSMP